ncbi:MAG: ComF family protein [Oscillospiraceae bacterium]|nr:ComF family protein [Oscillospiraceae bacterium]
MDKGIIKGDSSFRSYVLDLFFPNRCPFCGGFIGYDELCCEECFSEILWADENICRRCGKPFRPECGCGEPRNYQLCASAAYYTGAVREGIYSLKFKNNLNGAAIFGRALRDELKVMGVLDEIDVAVPVPMSPREMRSRGYNQAEELAKYITRGTDIPINTELIRRRFSKTAQHFLSVGERKAGAERIYYTELTGLPLSGMTVLLTDDVLTTGSTLNVCSALLLGLGAERIICAAAATV